MAMGAVCALRMEQVSDLVTAQGRGQRMGRDLDMVKEEDKTVQTDACRVERGNQKEVRQ